MTLKMGFKVQMTSFRSQKLWFDHVALYYDYYVTPWINSSQFKMSSAESELSVRKLWKWEFIWHMEWWWWRKSTRIEWKLRCAVCIWTKSTNSQCGEQQYTASWYWVGRKGGGGNYWQNLKFRLVSQVQSSKLLFQPLTDLNI